MTGYLLAALLWYAVMTSAAMAGAQVYNRWIAERSTSSLLPTSVQVAIGVAGVEALRVVRVLPLLIVIAAKSGWGALAGLLIVVGLVVDGLIGYVAAGGPMIAGDLQREAAARRAAEAQTIERMVRLAREAREAADAGE